MPKKKPADKIKPKIVIMDDDAELTIELKNILSFFDYEVVIYDSPQFVHKLIKQKPDVLLVDVWFNGLADGLNEVRAVSLQEKLSKTSVILMSSDPKVADYAKAVKATTYLTKPLDPEVLIKTLEAVLPHSAL